MKKLGTLPRDQFEQDLKEKVKHAYLHTGGVPSTFIVFFRQKGYKGEDDIQVAVVPFTGREDKRFEILAEMGKDAKSFLPNLDFIEATVWLGEAWMGKPINFKGMTEEEKNKLSTNPPKPSEDPDKTECIIVAARYADKGTSMSCQDILPTMDSQGRMTKTVVDSPHFKDTPTDLQLRILDTFWKEYQA